MEREILRTALAPSAECVSMEQLGRYADDALGADEQATAAAHIRRCLNCQAELALLQAATSTGVRTEEADVVREGVARLEQRAAEIVGGGGVAPPSQGRWLPRAMLAAAAVLLVVAGSFYARMGQAPELPRAVTTEGEVTRSLAVAVRGPIGDQAEAPRRFEWLAVDGAVRYRVRLMEVDRREVWSAATSALQADLPPRIRTSLAPGRTLLWDVTAYDATGAAIAESGPQSFRLVLG